MVVAVLEKGALEEEQAWEKDEFGCGRVGFEISSRQLHTYS